MDNKIPHILIVDDDANLLATMSDILKLKGFDPFIAQTGVMALAQIEEHRFDLALIDLRLGDMSGLKVLRAIKARSPETECILLTGHASQNSAIEAIEAGVYGYFQKPFEMEQVLLSIQRAVEKSAAKKALYESEKRLQSLIENAPDGIVLVGLDGKYKYASPAALRIFGYNMEDVTGGNPVEQTHPEDLPMVLEVLQNLIANPSNVPTIQYRFKHGDSSWRWIESTFTNLRAEPSVEAIVINFRDITERKRAEEALAASESKLRALVEQVPAIVYTESAKTRETLYISPQVEKITGYTPAEWVKDHDTWKKMIHPQDLNALLAVDERTNENLEPFYNEYRILTRDGRTRWIHDEAVVIQNQNGTPLFWHGVMYDITERKQVEEALRQRENLLNKIFDVLPVGLWLADKNGKLTRSNQSGREIWGAEPLVGQEQYGVFKARHLPSGEEFSPDDWALAHTIQEGVTVLDEMLEIETFDGQKKVILNYTTPIFNETGKVDGAVIVNLDITERKQAEEALHESEEKYRLLIDQSPYAISIHQDGKLIFVNPAAVSMLGAQSADELIGRPISAVIHPDEMDATRDRIQRMLQGETGLYPVEDRNVRLDGSVVPVEVSAAPFTFKGSPAIQVIALDITKRKQAEELIRESEQRYHSIFDGVQDAIFIETKDGRILEVNKRACEIFGYKRDEFLKKTVSDLVPKGQKIIYPADTEPKTSSLPIETVNRRANGELFPIEISGGVQVINGEEVLLAIVRDITERKLAQENIRQHIKELELLYQSGLVFSQLLNPKEIAQKIINLLGEKLNWHHTAIRLVHGQDELELLAFDQPGLEDKAQAQAVLTHFKNVVTHIGEGLSGWAIQQAKTVRLGDVSSDPHYIATYPGLHSGLYIPLKSGDRMVGVISIESEQPDAFSEADEQLLTTLANQAANAFENARLYQTAQQEIVERKRIENLLAEERNQLAQRVEERTSDLSRVNADLEHAVRVKDEFLASMSHELRTPLTGILGLSEVLQLKIYGELNDKQSTALKNIEESGRHLLDLINDILDLSKIEARKLELQFAPYSLADICQGSLQLIKGMVQHKHQHVNYSFPTEPIIVRADARRLKQVLVNLLSNAIKFTPENGELGLEVEAIQSERKIKLTVWDKGIGIKPEDMHKLFKPFTQLDSGLSREYSGTGLGLSLVQHLTELHNGGIEVESNLGKGSRFTIILPWSPQNTTPIPYTFHRGNTGQLSSSTVSLEHSKAPLVMYVDDNEMVLKMVGDFLEAEQYRVMKVRSGLELLERAAEHHPNIMLVDIQMPGIGGMETIRRVRAHPDPLVAAAPVIAVTALAMPADRERCLRAGANDYMSKPLKLKELAAAIEKLLKRKQ